MSLAPKLILRQSQALVMTPQLLQAIKLLQLSSVDLEAFVEGEIERNPLLDHADGDPALGELASEAVPEPAPSSTGEDWLDAGGENGVSDRVDAAPADLFPDDAPSRPSNDGPSLGDWTGIRATSGEPADLEAIVAKERGLADHLAEQMALAGLDERRRLIGASLIASLDEAGYLRESTAEIAARLGLPDHEVEAVLALCKTFDPAGLFARDLAECLALQLAERDRLDPAMQALLANLDMLARRDFAGLRRVCGVDAEDVADMLAEIKALNPKPGAGLGGPPVQTLVPDVVVRAGTNGTWTVELNGDAMPRVLVNQAYYARVAGSARGPREIAYLGDALQSANWLVKSLDQRARTILKVAAEIVRHQDAFLAGGVRHLRPLNLKTIADAIGMHESTVSRVTSNKAIATPRGIFEMKYFFTSAISAADGGEAHSAEAVRHRIKQMIDKEAAHDVLSDDVIVRRLKDEGIDIARRTIAKYTDSLCIPSSVQRRR